MFHLTFHALRTRAVVTWIRLAVWDDTLFVFHVLLPTAFVFEGQVFMEDFRGSHFDRHEAPLMTGALH